MHDISTEDVNAKRIVLGDWYEDDCVLIHDDNGYRFERIENYINTYKVASA
jgi:UDP-2,3-diacylglucosamine pyrophosphatase LpxH